MANGAEHDFPAEILAVSGISCSLSILGGLVILGTYWRNAAIRNYTRLLLVYLTIADMITATGYLLSVIRYSVVGGGYSDSEPWYPLQNYSSDTEMSTLTNSYGSASGPSDPLCRIQSFLTTFSSMASFFWTVFIAAHIHYSVLYRSRHQDSVCLMNFFHLISWLVPGLITVVAAGCGVLGGDTLHPTTTGPWCWINAKSDLEATMWMVISGKGWEILCYLITAILYIRLKYYLYRKRGVKLSQIHEKLRDEDRNFMYVWLILYLQRMWGTIRFFIDLRNIYSAHTIPSLSPQKPTMKALLYLQAGGDPAQGFSNFILFCLADGTVRQELTRSCLRRRRGSNSSRLAPASDLQSVGYGTIE